MATTNRFHRLPVHEVRPLTRDAVVVTFAVPGELAPLFRFRQGQHVTIRHDVDGRALRRSYSICSPAPDGPLRVAIKRLEGGAFSTYATTRLRPGDTLDVMPPRGSFHTPLTPDTPRRHVAIAAGSGITPVLSLATTTLAHEPASTFTLVYGNRTAEGIMFLDELADLKDRCPDRFGLVHVLSGETTEAPFTGGRIDAAKLTALFDAVAPPDRVDHWFLCGPAGLVEIARTRLRERGVAASRVHSELFHAAPPPPAPRRSSGSGAATALRLTLDGRTTTVAAGRDETVLTAALRVRGDAPYSCRGGVCGTCRAKLRGGEVETDRDHALDAEERELGYVLTCRSRPVTADVAVDYDV